jgi:hypothetical protein
MTRADEAFAIYKAPHVAEGTIRNLMRADPAKHLGRAAAEWEGDQEGGCSPRDVAFTIVGAGHTMGDGVNLNLRAGHRQTIVVNSAIGACLLRGLVPMYTLCRESIDMSHQLRALPPKATRAILDIGTHPDVWAAAHEVCRDVTWFISAATQNREIIRHYRKEPVYGGTSNVTAAVAVAEMMGATRIELVGCSRAFSKDGRAYAEGTGWESVRLAGVDAAHREDGSVAEYVGTIEGTECKERLHLASGQRPPLKRERVVPVTDIHGERRWATEPLEGDRAWLENFAARHPHVSFYQHNPDVAIAGWGHKPAIELQPRTVDFATMAKAECDRALAMGKAAAAGEPPWSVEGWAGSTSLVDFAGVGDRLTVLRAMRGRPPTDTIPAVQRAWAGAAERVRGWVE